ncbi:hypothetical protein [Sporolactobacillus laevolacticus]|uniref:hypothetical protein n=1 Tax=Sporolactobacillus laevolacticus TaxID=33018 RepID=UPI0025B4CDE8|nr:hypothetical protein [Sporolactobacillus laevolacticus]MDN3956203.1 hypothetical protein [Sporolactobacillus laevolacticus]
MYVWNSNERDKKIKDNYRKANYLDYEKECRKPHYENGMKDDIPKTKRELDRLIYSSVYSAQKGLLNVLIPRFNDLCDRQQTILKALDEAQIKLNEILIDEK